MLDEVTLGVLGAAAVVGVVLGLALTRSSRRTAPAPDRTPRDGAAASPSRVVRSPARRAARSGAHPAPWPATAAPEAPGGAADAGPARVRFTAIRAGASLRPAPLSPAAPLRAAPAATQDPDRGLRLTRDALWSMRTGRATRGMCSQCRSTLWLSAKRPLLARCPVCGHSRILT